ncbi:hypothetical protein HPB52_001027 [Rhipicephalus sanguineus]|uniref:Uncharacterized protein n=1 Tax=Rhipicephalus sanguineus TaxID=34632 RepID=A0A9D4PC48_RHISA|nr:hypothetical protein HPB52_001027 [Rhipicephalus sanguineus]
MLLRLCPPVPPFRPAYPRAWFMRLDAILAVNDIKAQPMMHAVLLNALPVQLCHLAAESSSSPLPYNDLCAAVLACYGKTYRPLPWSREFQVSPPSQRAVPTGPQPYLDKDLTSPSTTPSTSDAPTGASIPASDHYDEVKDAPTSTDLPTDRCVPSKPLYEGPSRVPATHTSSPTSIACDASEPSDPTTATLRPALESDAYIAPPAICSPIVEDLSSSSVKHHHVSTTSTLCVSCQQRPASPSQSTAAEVRAPNHQRPNLRDAATMTKASEDDLPGSPMAEQAAHVTPATSAGIQLADLRTSPRVPPAEGASTRTGALSEPAATTPARCHRRFAPEPLTQDAAHMTCGHCAGALCRPPPHVYSHRTRRYFVSRRRQRALSAASSHRHCCSLSNTSPHAQPTFWDRFRHAERRAPLLLPTASIRRDPRPLRSSQSRPPETHWSPMVISR